MHPDRSGFIPGHHAEQDQLILRSVREVLPVLVVRVEEQVRTGVEIVAESILFRLDDPCAADGAVRGFVEKSSASRTSIMGIFLLFDSIESLLACA